MLSSIGAAPATPRPWPTLLLEGAEGAGAEADLLTPDQVDSASAGGYAAVALGCPAMGAEVLEEMRVRAHVLAICKRRL